MMTLEEFKFYYYSIYIFAAFFALLIAMRIQVRHSSHSAIDLFLVGVICLILLVLYGNRSILVGTDTGLMMDLFTYNERIGDKRDPFINLLIKILKNFTNAQGYIAFLASMYLGNIFLFIKNRNNTANKFIFFFLVLSLFFFKSMGINVVRQGVSLAFFLNALNFYEQKKKMWAFVFCGLSIAFHTTGVIPVALFLVAIFLSSKPTGLKIAYGILTISSLLAILQVNMFRFLPSSIGIDALDVRSGYYNGDDWGYEIGFRPTFFAFNIIFIVISILIQKYLKRQRAFEENERQRMYLIYFILASSIFFTAFQIPFSDRWGLFSWIFIPLLIEPLFRSSGKSFALMAVLFSISLFVIFEFVIK